MIAKSIERFEPMPIRNHLNFDRPEGAGHDQNTYCYRLVNSVMVFRCVGLGPGWENRPMDWEKLSCYKAKGEKSMPSIEKLTPPPREELERAKDESSSLISLAKKYNVGATTMHKWLKNYKISTVFRTSQAKTVMEKTCKKCGADLDDVRYYHDGWVCPRCAGVEEKSKEESPHPKDVPPVDPNEIEYCKSCGEPHADCWLNSNEGPYCYPCLVYLQKQKDQDEEPIPYLVAADPIAGLKVTLIAAVLVERDRNSNLSDEQLLNVIQGIQGLTA